MICCVLGYDEYVAYNMTTYRNATKTHGVCGNAHEAVSQCVF